MATQSNNLAEKISKNMTISSKVPPQAARIYIIDMLAELCGVAKDSQQEDLHILLKLVRQAAINAD